MLRIVRESVKLRDRCDKHLVTANCDTVRVGFQPQKLRCFGVRWRQFVDRFTGADEHIAVWGKFDHTGMVEFRIQNLKLIPFRNLDFDQSDLWVVEELFL